MQIIILRSHAMNINTSIHIAGEIEMTVRYQNDLIPAQGLLFQRLAGQLN